MSLFSALFGKKKKEMDTEKVTPVMLYTEQTPNPETLKFVTNKMLHPNTAEFRDPDLAEEWSPFAVALLQMPYIKSVYFSNNFVTLTKEINYDWADIMLKAKEFIKKYIDSGEIIIKEGFEEAMTKLEEDHGYGYQYDEETGLIVKKIKDILDKYVKPAVQNDGGNITFKSYVDGDVTVIMQGSCAGCPSSSATLKGSIETMLGRMVPQVTEVIAEDE